MMKPRLRDDVHFVPVRDGVFVMVPSSATMGFSIGGRDTYDWLWRIAPFLTGEHTLDELGRSLDERRRERMRLLIALLHRGGALRDAAEDLPHTLSEELRQTYARVIGYIGGCADSPEHRFQLYRRSGPIVVGSGLLVAPLVQALLVTGVAHVRLILTSERPTVLARMREYLALTLGSDAERNLDVTTMETIAQPEVAAGAVLHVSDFPMAARAGLLERLCATRNLVFGQATVVDNQGVIGPVGRPGQLQPGWEVSLWRLARGDPADPIQDLPNSSASEYLAGPTAAIVANHLCAAFLKHVTGLSRAAASQFIKIDLETLQANVHPIPAVPASEQELPI